MSKTRNGRAYDPVCGMAIDNHAGVCTDYDGKHFCFCNDECKQEFGAEPEIYVCEVRQAGLKLAREANQALRDAYDETE